jgi:hypothetical protein
VLLLADLPIHPPISRIVFIAVAVCVGSTLCLWFGPNYLDNRRRALGSALIGGGFLLVALAFGLCLTIGLRGTWGGCCDCPRESPSSAANSASPETTRHAFSIRPLY